MTLFSFKAMLLKNASSENSQKDKMSITLSSFWKGQVTKENQKLKRQLEKTTFWGELPMF